MKTSLVTVTHEQLRLDFFQNQKRSCERKLHWWKHQKPYKQYDAAMIADKCDYYGQAVAYYEDAIKTFGGDDHGK